MNRIHVDNAKCLGCKACEIACVIEHYPEKSFNNLIGNKGVCSNIKVLFVNDHNAVYFCKHCTNAKCIEKCPQNAIKVNENGIVYIDLSICKLCKRCLSSCPFHAIFFKKTDKGKFIIAKCDLCIERIKNGYNPSCVDACKTKALSFITTIN